MSDESDIRELSEFCRAIRREGPDGPCIEIQERRHEEDRWDESVTFYTNEAGRLYGFLEDTEDIAPVGQD